MGLGCDGVEEGRTLVDLQVVCDLFDLCVWACESVNQSAGRCV